MTDSATLQRARRRARGVPERRWLSHTCVECGGHVPSSADRCRPCYLAWRQTGAMRAPLGDRFWQYVDKDGPGGCWLWTAFLYEGYGRFTVEKGRAVGAHRVAFELTRGPIPDGLELDHLCRVRACVNPAHLEPVTGEENKRRANEDRVPVEFCKRGHPFDEANTYRWRGERMCRQCRAEMQRARNAA